MPFDVRSFKAEKIVIQTNVKIAHGTATPVSAQNLLAEPGVALYARCNPHLPVQGKSDGRENVIVPCFGEILVEQLPHGFLHQSRIAP